MSAGPVPHLLVRGARLVEIDPPTTGPKGAVGDPVDLRLRAGRVVERGAGLAADGAEVLDATGTWAIPGLWDQHVHMSQWAALRRRLDVADTDGPEDVLARVRRHLDLTADDADEGGTLLEGFGWRLGGWSRLPSTAELDAVCGDRPVALISGDCHGGWLSSAAYRALGEEPRPGHVDEDEWFALWRRFEHLPQSPRVRAGLEQVMDAAAALGVVGITDLEQATGLWRTWPERVVGGLDRLRVRPATYPDGLDLALADGVRTGDVLDRDPGASGGLVTMGPLKVISDGSLNTRTAWCCDPFVTDDVIPEPRGKRNVPPAELADLLRRAGAGGLQAAVHAIGDAALDDALTAFEESGARGTIEHAQLVRLADLPRMARLGVAASVQPAHLLDDRDTSEALWPDRGDRCFALAAMRDAGVELRLGSDAPVAPLDPWEAMAAAVHRSADERAPWVPAQAITPRQALAASTDGQRLAVGDRGDLALLAEDPFADVDTLDAGGTADAAARLRAAPVLATLLAGRLTHTS